MEETKPVSIERIGENKMIVEHDSGDKFECSFNGNFPEQLKRDKKPPVSIKYISGIGNGKGSILEWRKKLGLVEGD